MLPAGRPRAPWPSSAGPTTRPPASCSAAIEHRPSRIAVDAERAFLAELGGDCDLPAGAHATVAGEVVTLEGLLASMDGHVVLRERRTVPVAGADAAGRALARFLLDDAGGASLLTR